MRIAKYLLAINGVTLAINGVIVWLTIVKSFPALPGIMLVLGCLAAAVWFSCYVNGKLPRRRRSYQFYTKPTEEIERIRY